MLDLKDCSSLLRVSKATALLVTSFLGHDDETVWDTLTSLKAHQWCLLKSDLLSEFPTLDTWNNANGASKHIRVLDKSSETFRVFNRKLRTVITYSRYLKASSQQSANIWSSMSQSNQKCWCTYFGKPVSIIHSLQSEVSVIASKIPSALSYNVYILHGIIDISFMS